MDHVWKGGKYGSEDSENKGFHFLAFETLLMEKSYSNITVQNVIERANIGRSTFYSHFETKDDLLKAMCAELFDHIFSPNLTPESSHDFSGAQQVRGMITHIFYHLKEQEVRLKHVFSCESADLFWRYFQQPFSGLAVEYIVPFVGKEKISVPEDYLVNYISTSFMQTVKWWFKNALSESPEELERYFECTVLGIRDAKCTCC